ncbi:MAG: uracil phosphoribosyltransferase [Eggerthellaceae bacterium]
MDHGFGDRFTVLDHPLIKHKLSVLRDENTPSFIFRRTVSEITLLECYEATKHLVTREVEVKTPLATCTCDTIAKQEPVIVPILRAGLGMLDAVLEMIPSAPVAHLGMYRNEETHEPIEYYAKMPGYIHERQVLLIDPMLATGGSLIAALHALRQRGVKDIVAMVIVASPEGVKAVLDADPDVRLFACALDEALNDDAYIVPGLGDAGDRIFQTTDAPVTSEGSQI